MLVRQPLLPQPAPQEEEPFFARFSHSALQTLKGFLRNPLRVSLPHNDPVMAGALAALLGVMLYVAALALLGHYVLSHAASAMDNGLQGALTIEIAPAAEAQKDWKSAEERASAAQEKLKGLSGIKHVARVPEAQMAALLSPWLGENKTLRGLPLPLLLDVGLDERATIDRGALTKALEGIPGVTLDDHGRFLTELTSFADALRITASVIVAISLVGLVLAAYFSAQATYYINRDMIEILHMIGAEDSAIAGYTGTAILRLALFAACVALGLSLLTLMALLLAQQGMDFSFLPSLHFSFLDWIVLLLQWLLLLVAAIGACLMAARFTVLASLSRLP